MTPVDVYRLTIPAGQIALVFALMIVSSVFGVGMLVLAAREPGVHLALAVMLCAGVGWNWYIFLGIPYEIRFDAPDRLSFVALRGTTTLSTSKLHSLTPYRRGGGAYVLRHEGGKIRVIAQMTGFHEVIARIKAANRNFEVVGI